MDFAKIKVVGKGVTPENYKIYLDDRDISHLTTNLEILMAAGELSIVKLTVVASELYIELDVDRESLEVEHND